MRKGRPGNRAALSLCGDGLLGWAAMRTTILCLMLLIASCRDEPQPPSAAENAQLDEMENALDAEAAR